MSNDTLSRSPSFQKTTKSTITSGQATHLEIKQRVRYSGFVAEDLATTYLENLNYQILARNFRVRGSEIDIIAKKSDTLAFVEVKKCKRVPTSMDKLRSLLPPRKCVALRRGAESYILQTGKDSHFYLRFDLIIVCDGAVRVHTENILLSGS